MTPSTKTPPGVSARDAGPAPASSLLVVGDAPWRAVFDDAPLGMVVIAADGRISAVNRALAAILGVDQDALVGASALALLAGADPDGAHRVRLFMEGRAERKQIDTRLRDRDGRMRHVRLTGARIPTPDGSMAFGVGVLEDVSERVAIADALHRSEERLALALDATHTGWWEYDATTGRTHRSAHALSLLDATGAEGEAQLPVAPDGTSSWAHTDWYAHVHPEDLAGILEAWEMHERGDAPRFMVEYRLRTMRGEWRWVSSSGSIVERGPDGCVRRAIGTESDVTSRREAEEGLRRSERRLRALIEHATDTISLCDAEGTITYASPSHVAVLGIRPAELVGMRLRELVHPEDLGRTQLLFGALLEQPGASAAIDVRIRHRTGAWRWLDIVATNLLEDPAVAAIVFNSRDVTDRRLAEAAVAESAERARLVAHATNDAVWDYHVGTGRLVWNDALRTLWGYPAGLTETTVAWWGERLHPDDRERVTASFDAAIRGAGDSWREEYRFRRADGQYATVFDRGYLMRDADGRPLRFVGAMTDFTEQRRLEEQLRHSQKMEAVGQLAGGVAHDFNNLLTVIFSGLEMARAELPPQATARAEIDEVLRAAQSAATLTRQLLAFSRKQVLQPRALDLGAVVRASESMLRRVIGERVVLDVHGGEGLWPVHADPGQLEQVLVNLVVNARDAMPDGGSIAIEVANRRLTALTTTLWGELPPGEYVRLSVADTGVGMDALTRARIFEPFFTTKPVGRGTGLGLATVYGIVTQSGGTVQVESAPGRGSTFHILLPRAAGAANVPGGRRSSAPRGCETILLVEDESPVRVALRRTLERHGYKVIEAKHGRDGLLAWSSYRDSIAAVLTDLRMPELGGREMAAQLRADRDRLPVLYISGYADEGQRAPLHAGEAFIAKPFVTDELLRTLRGLIDAAAIAA